MSSGQSDASHALDDIMIHHRMSEMSINEAHFLLLAGIAADVGRNSFFAASEHDWTAHLPAQTHNESPVMGQWQ